MLTLTFDTTKDNRVYVGDNPNIRQILLTIPLIILIIAIFFSIMWSAALLGANFNGIVGGILKIVFFIMGFIISVIIIAMIVYFIRYKIMKTYGYLRFEDDKLEISFTDENRQNKFFDKKDIFVNSANYGDGVRISLKTPTAESDLSYLFTNKNDVFELKSRKNEYPCDEVLAAWLSVDLVRNGQKIAVDESKYLF